VLKNVACVLAENDATFAATDLERGRTLYTRQLDGKFPDTKAVIPGGQPDAVVAVDAELLIELLQVAKQFTGDDGPKRVVLELRRNPRCPDAGIPVVVRAQNADGQRFTGLLMPLTEPRP
jgi:hypothetical protein